MFTVSVVTAGRSPTLLRNATGVGWTTVELLGVQGRNYQSSLFATRGPTHIHGTPIAHTVERLLCASKPGITGLLNYSTISPREI